MFLLHFSRFKTFLFFGHSKTKVRKCVLCVYAGTPLRKHIAAQARKALYLLYSRINNLNLPVDLQLKLFDSTVLPILTYGCEIWGFENLEILERIHAEFLRNITKARKSTPHYMLYAELGRYPLDITIKSRMIGFWNRIVTGNDSKLSYLLYYGGLPPFYYRFRSKLFTNQKHF